MKELWNTAQVIFAAIGGWLGYFLGGCDGLLIALVVFVAVDYLTGVICAVSDKKLSSEVGFKGICRKVLIFLLVGIANILDCLLYTSWRRICSPQSPRTLPLTQPRRWVPWPAAWAERAAPLLEPSLPSSR